MREAAVSLALLSTRTPKQTPLPVMRPRVLRDEGGAEGGLHLQRWHRRYRLRRRHRPHSAPCGLAGTGLAAPLPRRLLLHQRRQQLLVTVTLTVPAGLRLPRRTRPSHAQHSSRHWHRRAEAQAPWLRRASLLVVRLWPLLCTMHYQYDDEAGTEKSTHTRWTMRRPRMWHRLAVTAPLAVVAAVAVLDAEGGEGVAAVGVPAARRGGR